MIKRNFADEPFRGLTSIDVLTRTRKVIHQIFRVRVRNSQSAIRYCPMELPDFHAVLRSHIE